MNPNDYLYQYLVELQVSKMFLNDRTGSIIFYNDNNLIEKSSEHFAILRQKLKIPDDYWGDVKLVYDMEDGKIPITDEIWNSILELYLIT